MKKWSKCGESVVPETHAAKKARYRIVNMCIIVLFALTVLAAILIVPHLMPSSAYPMATTQTTSPTYTCPSTEPPKTEPTLAPTTAPTEPTAPPTEPTAPPPAETYPPEPTTNELIGTLYTRAQLMAMDHNAVDYGPGSTSGGKRAPYADPMQAKYGKMGGNFIAPDNGNIYLTFDCGYEYIATDADGCKYRVTERILDILKEKNVKAVFFVTMPYAKEQPDLVRRMIDEGHAVGNHTKNHREFPNLTVDQMVYEVMSLHDYVKENFGYEMHLFRFPCGTFSQRSLAVLQTLGYKSVHWSFAYADYETEAQPDIQTALKKVTGSHHSGAIYLLHAISTTNAAILPDTIDFFQAEGYHLELFD